MTGGTKRTSRHPARTAQGQLRGSSVFLRPPRPEDTRQLFDWLNEPEVAFPWDSFGVDSYHVFENGLHSASASEQSLYPRFVIALRSDERPIGVVGYYRAHPVLEGYDLWYDICEPAERGKGYGKEAVRLLSGYLFANTHVERLGAVCDVENVASYRLLESLGYKREGTLHHALFHHGEWHDAHLYGVNREAWTRR